MLHRQKQTPKGQLEQRCSFLAARLWAWARLGMRLDACGFVNIVLPLFAMSLFAMSLFEHPHTVDTWLS